MSETNPIYQTPHDTDAEPAIKAVRVPLTDRQREGLNAGGAHVFGAPYGNTLDSEPIAGALNRVTTPEPRWQTIYGTCPSKSNCYRISENRLHKTRALEKYENDFYIQCNRYRNAGVDGYFEFWVRVFYPNQRADLDNSLKVVLDCLQRVKAIKNDNRCVKIVAEKFLDAKNSRIEFCIVPV